MLFYINLYTGKAATVKHFVRTTKEGMVMHRLVGDAIVERDRLENRCPACTAGRLYCTFNGLTWDEVCDSPSCNYRATHHNRRVHAQKIPFKDRRHNG